MSVTTVPLTSDSRVVASEADSLIPNKADLTTKLMIIRDTNLVPTYRQLPLRPTAIGYHIPIRLTTSMETVEAARISDQTVQILQSVRTGR